MQLSRLLVSYPGMKELLRQVLETAPLSDRRIMAAAMLGSAVLLTVAAICSYSRCEWPQGDLAET
jgi:hypothetical protein